MGRPVRTASTVSSGCAGASLLRRAGLLGLASLLSAFAFALVSGSAQAAYIHKPAGTFELQSLRNGEPGAQPGAIAVDEETGDVYVMQWNFRNSRQGWIEKFDAEGNPADFSGRTTTFPAIDETQTIEFAGEWANGNTFTLTCPNSETTAAIEWHDYSNVPELQENMKAALEAKCGSAFSVESGPYYPRVRFEGPYAETDEPPMTCTKVTGTGSCKLYSEVNGAPAETVHNVLPMTFQSYPEEIREGCAQECYEIAVDNSGGPNQGVIYVSSTAPVPTPINRVAGGIWTYLPSGQMAGGTLASGEPAGRIYARSQSEFDVRACGVAVDENGNLIVAHGEGSQEFAYIDHLSIEPWGTSPLQEPEVLGTIGSDSSNPCRTHLDSNGFIYTQTGQGKFESGAVRKRDPNLFHAPSGIGRIPESAKDPSTLADAGPDISFDLDAEDNLYGLRSSGPARVVKVDQGDSPIETFGEGELFSPRDIAVNRSTGTVYVTDEGENSEAKDVHIYKAFKVPDSKTGAFTGVTQTSGTLNGELDPVGAGEVKNCEFEYTTEALYKAKEFEEATQIACEPGTSFTGPASVEAPVSGLTLEQPYVFRLVTENANGASNGTIHKFVPHAVINLTTKPATSVAPRSATLNASFTGNGEPTEYYFEYGHGLAGVFPEKTATESAGSPSVDTQLSIPISELELETTYHFRVVATNVTGTSKGFEESFTTPPAVAGLTTKSATEIGQDSVTLNASFTGNGHDTHYYFEYGPTTEYGLVSDAAPGSDAGATFGTTNVASQITQYYGYTTYHYRVVAENEFGVTKGKDMTFTTEAAPLPEISETSVSELTPTEATFSGMVSPNRWDASWLFEWGESTAYEGLTELEDILSGASFGEYQPVYARIGGLKPATIYHYRVVAFNFTGVTNGPDQTFITPDVPKIDSSVVSAVHETSAHLSARVVANSSPTSVHFEFGPSFGYGAATPAVAIGSGSLAGEAAADLTGLTPGTTYHYRVVGVNQFGTTRGPDQTFTTQAAPQGPAEPKENCGKLVRRAKQARNRARALRGRASRTHNDRKARTLRHRAASVARRANSLAKEAGACERENRRAAR